MSARKSVNTRPQGAWSIKGRGKSAQYRVAFKAGTLNAGDAFQVTNKQGVTRTGVTTDLVESADGLDYWTVQLDKQSPEERAAAQALKAQANAEYWSSERGLETARKMQERQERKSAPNTTIGADDGDSAPNTPNRGGVETSAPTSAPTTSALDPTMLAQVIAGLIAQGIAPEVAAQTALALSANAPTSIAAPTSAPKSVRTTTQTARGPQNAPTTRAPRAKSAPKSAPKSAQSAGQCVSCGKSAPTLSFHKGAQVDGVCDACMSADGDTVRTRAIRRGLKVSS